MERTKERSSFRKKFIGDRKFYMMVLAVAVPIMIQNGITNFVSLLDNIMIGRIGTEQMSGASIVNQLIFVYNLCIFGGVSGAGIFTAQYFGQTLMKGRIATCDPCKRRAGKLRCSGRCRTYNFRIYCYIRRLGFYLYGSCHVLDRKSVV